MAPCDWIALARTVLTPAQFTVWHSEYSHQAGHQAGHQAAENAQMNNSVTFPVLRGYDDFPPLQIRLGMILMLLVKVLKLLSEP